MESPPWFSDFRARKLGDIVTLADAPHGRGRYNRGCRCGTCRRANREYARSRRSRHLESVTPPPPAPPEKSGPGRVAAAVRAQLDALGPVDRPGLVAIALVLAEDLDDQSAIPQHPAIAHRLTEVLEKLTRVAPRSARLSVVRSLTNRSDRRG